MINHREAGRAPSTVRCGVPDNVEQLWIDENPVQGFASAVRSNGSEVVVLNGRAFEFQTVLSEEEAWLEETSGCLFIFS